MNENVKDVKDENDTGKEVLDSPLLKAKFSHLAEF